MGSLRTLTILLALGAWGAATEGAPPGDGTSPDAGSSRASLPAPAVEYLKGGIRLFNTGDQANASKYLKVASDYRDQLQPGEQAQLDDYLAKLNPATATAAKAPTDAAVRPASTDASPATAAPAANVAQRATTDLKQEARWKLQGAREQMRMGNYDEATRIVLEVQKMNVKWGLFDETPAKLSEAIAKARPKAAAAETGGAHDKKQALAKLKEARDMLANNQFEQAEALALEVNSWGLSYSVFDDKPSKVAAAARALRNRDKARNVAPKMQPSLGIYEALVAESRGLMAAGQLDQAEAKARQALSMGVYPSSTADRAEAVLNDISVAKSGTRPAAAPTAVASASPVTDTPSVVAERKANELLAKGQNDAAAAKFVEADNLKVRETAQTTVVDSSIRKVSNAPAAEAPAEAAAPPVLDAAQAVAGAPALADGPPVAIADPTAPPSAMPNPEPAALQPPSTAPALSSDGPPAGNKGEELLAQAKTLFSGSNYGAAREKAAEAKAGQYGVEAQADELLAQIALSEQGSALAVYEAALDALRKNDIDRARAMLTEVANSPAALDEGMLQKVQNLLLKLPKDGTGKSVASDVPTSDAESLKAQQMNMEVGTKVAEARRMMETDPDRAIALLQTTLTSVKAAELPQTVARTMTRRLEVAIELSKKDKVAFDVKMLDKNAKAEIETKKLRILEADMAKRNAVNDLMKKAEEAMAKGDYANAEQLARRAGEIDPDAIGPQMLAFKSNVQRHMETDKLNKRNKEEGFLGELQDVDAAMVIDNNLSRNGISYPKNFRELSERRRKMQLNDTRQKTVQELSIEKKLNEPITLNMKDQTLDEAITFISNYTGLNVIVDPKALNDEGLSRDSKVSLTANSIKLKNALKFMLRPLGLTYKAEDDVLLITSPQASRDRTYTWTYPVADLVVPPNTATLTNPASMGYPVSGPADVMPIQAMGMGGATQGTGSTPTAKVNAKTVNISDMMPLIQLISSTIAPNTWKIADPSGEGGAYGMGGGFGGANDAADQAQPGSITPFLLSISLIIRHTAEVHEEVAELLRQLRRLQDLQVSIEVRFITVSDDFFEQIGVDFDFNIQSKAVGKKTTFAAPSGSVQAGTYPFNLVSSTSSGSTSGGTTTGGSTTGGATGGGTTGTNGTTGGGGSTTGGGAGGGGGVTAGGTGGGGTGGGGFAGGGGGTGGAGGFGGGGAGTTQGGNSSNAGGTGQTGVGYVVNPFLDNSLGRRTPVVVGTSAPGIGNYTNNLGIPLTQGSATQIQPFNGIPTAGATLGISFLSDLEMYLFLTAAQGDTRNNIVQAPKVTTFNGANATLTNAEVQYYISQLTPILGPASVAFSPTPAQLNDGVTLSVTPVVSADRRYVRLSLAPVFQTINGLQSFPVPGAVGGGGLGGSGVAISGQIQLPLTTVTNINTTVTVPDGGTVLLGGVKRMREQRLEFGVPVLSKTPYINRLFRNIGVGRRTDSLMLMVTPRIIILEEEEDRLGVKTINSAAP